MGHALAVRGPEVIEDVERISDRLVHRELAASDLWQLVQTAALAVLRHEEERVIG